MAKLFGTRGKAKSVTEAEVEVFKAEAAVEGALARSNDPDTDSEVRAARIRLAGAQAARDQFEKKFKLFGVVILLLGVGLAVLVVVTPPEGDYTGAVVGLILGVIGLNLVKGGIRG